MESLSEHELKQASYKEKAAIKWTENDLIAWIRDKRPDRLKNDDIDKLRKAQVLGEVFLSLSGNIDFFQKDCDLPAGVAFLLAKLSTELVEEEKKRNKQQAKDVDMFELPPDEKGRRHAIDAFKNGIPYKAARPLLHSSGLNWAFQPHPELYKIIKSHLTEHFTCYKENNVDKSNTPYYFYLGGAGTGKSRHGTEFASSVKEALELSKSYEHYDELAQRLRTPFVFQVSFGKSTSLTPEEVRDPYGAVGIRMLHQLLDEDLDNIRNKFVATPSEVFRLVAKAEGVDLYSELTGILVVDGIQNALSAEADSFYRFLDVIGGLSLMSRQEWQTQEGKLRRTPFIMTCVTGTLLGRQPLWRTSCQLCIYLPLNRLHAPTWKYDGSAVLNDNPATRLLLDDAGGHGRAIEAIADELAEYRNGCQPNITELANAVLIRLRETYSEAISLVRRNLLAVVQCVLARQEILLSGHIPGSAERWESIVAPGLLWFEQIETCRGFIYGPGYLVAPYMWLWLLARTLGECISGPVGNFLTSWQFNDYQHLLYLKTGKGEAGQVTWQNFETLCCYFRCLRSLGFSDGQEVEFGNLHSGCTKFTSLRSAYAIFGDNRMTVINRQLEYAEATRRYSTKAVLATDVATLNSEDQLRNVILHGPSAPAGEFFFSIEMNDRDSPSKIVREVGHFVKKKIDEKTYTEERNKSAGPDDFFMLYTTTRTPDSMALPDRSGLVDESCWESYFGPFAGRAYIASQYTS